MKYQIDAAVTLREKHCLMCPLRKDDGSDECILQDCSTFKTWDDQMKNCPLVNEARVERMEKALNSIIADCITAIDDGGPLRVKVLFRFIDKAKQALEGGDSK